MALDSNTAIIGFEQQDQERFAKLSGDFNPMHMDATLARRFLFGSVVVHGINVLLTALDRALFLEAKAVRIVSIGAKFRHPVRLNCELICNIERTCHEEARITVDSCGLRLIEIQVAWVAGNDSSLIPFSGLPDRGDVHDMKWEKLEKSVGTKQLKLDTSLAKSLYPQLVGSIPTYQIAALLATTRIVGMDCPGYRSIFGELELEFSDNPSGPSVVNYAVTSTDSRFRLVSIGLSGAGITGKITAFHRPKPQPQPSVVALQRFIRPSEFKLTRALIIGGSRGLGELAANLIAAGGGEVCLTYQQGKRDATRIIDAINNSCGRSQAIQFDVRDGGTDLLDKLETWRPSSLLYFATPPILQAGSKRFSTARFNDFVSIYVSAFSEIFYALIQGGRLRYVLYPSSIAVENRNSDMKEYVAAKVAGEALCSYLQTSHREISFEVPRLPRLPTDQTANLFGIEAEDPIPIMIDLLRCAR